MKTTLLIAAAASLLICARPAVAADAATPQPDATVEAKSDPKKELRELVGKVQAKLSARKRTEAGLTEELKEADLADELKEFDALIAKHKDEKTDDVAQILFMQAMLYREVLNDADKGAELIRQLKTDFPETTQGKKAVAILASIDQQAEGQKIQKSLAVGAEFPDFEGKDLAGKPLSIAAYKGKVVLIDFWATWCGPCVAELPHMLKAYQKHHDKGFEIIGISLDREQEKLTSFIKEREMTWPQLFDGKGELAQKYGVNSIPSAYLLDAEGKIAAKGNDLRGEGLEAEVAKLLGKK